MNIKEHIHWKYNIHTDKIEIPGVGRNDLAELLPEVGVKVGVELGVATGEYSEILMKANPTMEFYGVDPYIPYSGYKDYVRQSTFRSLEDEAHARLDKYPGYEFIKKLSSEAAKDFEDGSLDFVYIDANHSEPFVSEDIATWVPKVRKGGIAAGHDYARVKGRDGEDSSNWVVIPAIHKYVKEHGHELYIWGLEAKIPGLKRDPIRSWMILP